MAEDGEPARGSASPTHQDLDFATKTSIPPIRTQKFRSPHEAKSIQNSNSRLIKGLAARIQLHCAPNHNWKSRRKDLRDSVRNQMSGTKGDVHTKLDPCTDKVDRNIAIAWVDRMPCVSQSKLLRKREVEQHKLNQVAERRAELRHQWIEAHSENKRRLARIRQENEANRCRAAVLAQKYFWLTLLWSSAAQELIGKGVHEARLKRKELENAQHQIVYIQSVIRMLVVRRQFHRMKKATLMIQVGVRKFLRSLYLKRRTDAASLIIRCLTSMHHESSVKKAFQKLIKSVQTLKAFLRRYCMVRDARIMLLKTQWVKWETMHARQPFKDGKRSKPSISFGGPTPSGSNTVESSFSVIPVHDSVKHIICRQHCSARSAEVVQKFRERAKRRKKLLQSYEVDVIVEKCWLMGIKPEDSTEYQQVFKQIGVDLGPPPLLKTMETMATISKMHRAGMKLQDKQRHQAKALQEKHQTS